MGRGCMFALSAGVPRDKLSHLVSCSGRLPPLPSATGTLGRLTKGCEAYRPLPCERIKGRAAENQGCRSCRAPVCSWHFSPASGQVGMRLGMLRARGSCSCIEKESEKPETHISSPRAPNSTPRNLEAENAQADHGENPSRYHSRNRAACKRSPKKDPERGAPGRSKKKMHWSHRESNTDLFGHNELF